MRRRLPGVALRCAALHPGLFPNAPPGLPADGRVDRRRRRCDYQPRALREQGGLGPERRRGGWFHAPADANGFPSGGDSLQRERGAARLAAGRHGALPQANRDFNKLRKELKDSGVNPGKKNELDKETREKLDKARGKVTEADRALRKWLEKSPRKERGGEPGNAAASPACDGKHVAVVFGTGVAAVYTTEGKRLWIKFVETPTIGFGHSASPLFVGGKLIVHLNDLVALEPATGKELWRAKVSARHASPIAARAGKEDVLITPAGPVV